MSRIFGKGAFVVFVLILLALPENGSGQSAFVNLNFQSATLSSDRPWYYEVSTGSALPGWTVQIGGNSPDQIFYNTITLDAAGVTLQGPDSLAFPPLPGSYSVYLQSSSIFTPVVASASLSQIGFVPTTANSLQFVGLEGYGNGQVSLGGEVLGLSVLDRSGNYILYGADIRSLAGSTQELRFTSMYHVGLYIDDIRFSSVVVPEPGMAGFACLVVLWVMGRYFRAQRG